MHTLRLATRTANVSYNALVYFKKVFALLFKIMISNSHALVRATS